MSRWRDVRRLVEVISNGDGNSHPPPVPPMRLWLRLTCLLHCSTLEILVHPHNIIKVSIWVQLSPYQHDFDQC